MSQVDLNRDPHLMSRDELIALTNTIRSRLLEDNPNDKVSDEELAYAVRCIRAERMLAGAAHNKAKAKDAGPEVSVTLKDF